MLEIKEQRNWNLTKGKRRSKQDQLPPSSLCHSTNQEKSSLQWGFSECFRGCHSLWNSVLCPLSLSPSFGPKWSWYTQNADSCQEQTTIVVGFCKSDYDRSWLLDLLWLPTIVVDLGSMGCDRSRLLDLLFMHDDRSPSRARDYDRSWLLHSHILTFMKQRINLTLFSSFSLIICQHEWEWVCSNNYR